MQNWLTPREPGAFFSQLLGRAPGCRRPAITAGLAVVSICALLVFEAFSGDTVAQAAEPAPGTVTGVRVTGKTHASITLTWNAASSADFYSIHGRSTVDDWSIRVRGIADTTYTITDDDTGYNTKFAPVKSYYLKMKGWNCSSAHTEWRLGSDLACTASDSFSSQVTVTTPAVPTRPPPYFTAQWPMITFSNVAPAQTDGEVEVTLRWDSVEGANDYRVVRRPSGARLSEVGDGQILFDARQYTETVTATGDSVEYQVQGVIDGGDGGASTFVGAREISVEAGEIEYGPFSDTVALVLSAQSTDPFAARDDLPPDPEGIPPVREFFRTLGETVGVEAERMDGWAVLMWFIFSVGVAATLMAGTSAATSGGFVGPLPMAIGMLVMALLWGIAGPLYAGVPWEFALTPLALMVVSGVIMARTRRMIP